MLRHKSLVRFKISVACLCLGLMMAAPSAAVQIAFDSGDPNDSDPRPGFVNSAYSDGWDPGDNGGYGFLPWDDALFYGNPIEIDADAPEPDNNLGTPAFRFGTGASDYYASRSFAAGLQPGQSFRINLDSFSFATSGTQNGEIQWQLGLRSASGERLSLYTYDYYIGGASLFGNEQFNLYVSSANDNLHGGTPLPATCFDAPCTGYTAADGSDGFTFTVDILTADTYRLRIDDDGVHKVDATGQLQMGTRAGEVINGFYLYAGDKYQNNPVQIHTSYFNNIEILTTPIDGIEGDYNNDHVVDSRDYVLWRKLNGTGGHLDNDPNALPIDIDQYNTWVKNYGRSTAGGGGAVPEPSALVLMVLGAALIGKRRRSR